MQQPFFFPAKPLLRLNRNMLAHFHNGACMAQSIQMNPQFNTNRTAANNDNILSDLIFNGQTFETVFYLCNT